MTTKCESCGDNEATELHTCPYSEEINGDTTLCNCCDECQSNCLEEI